MYWQHVSDKAARVQNWKWVRHKVDAEYNQGAAEGGLFDLAADVGEQYDLSRERPDVSRMMQDRWAGWRTRMDETEPRGPFRDY